MFSARNLLLVAGIISGILLILLRLWGQFGTLSGELGMLANALGYEGTKNYAVLLIDPAQEPLLFLVSTTDGAVTFVSVSAKQSAFADIRHTDFSDAARGIVERIAASGEPETIDALAVVTTDAARVLVEAYGGLSIDNTAIDASNFTQAIRAIAESDNAAEKLNDSLVFSKRKLITSSKSMLPAAKKVFSQRLVAVYFKNEKLFGKSCLGACGKELFEYMKDGGSLER